MHKTIRNSITGIIGGILLSVGVANGQNAARNYIKFLEKDKNNTTLVPKNYQSVDPFQHIDPKKNNFVQFTAKNPNPSEFVTLNPSPNNIHYSVITFDEYVKRSKNAIAREDNSWFGYYKPNKSTDESILTFVEQTPFHKLSTLGPLNDLVAFYLNNTNRINMDGIMRDVKGVLTPKEVSDIVSKIYADSCDNMVIPVLASTPAYKNIPGEEVPRLLLFMTGYGINKPVITKKPETTPVKPVNKPQTNSQSSASLDSLILELRKSNEEKKNGQGQGNTNIIDSYNTVIIINQASAEKKDTTPNTPNTRKDSTETQGNVQIYLGAGPEINSFIKKNVLIGQYKLGIKIKSVAFGVLFGYNGNIEKDTQEYFPNADKNGETLIKKNMKSTVMQPGLEAMFFPIKNLGIGLGIQDNIVSFDSTGTLYQSVNDQIGHGKVNEIPLVEKTGKLNYISFNPMLELKMNKVAIYAGGKFALKPEYRDANSIFAGVKVYIGK